MKKCQAQGLARRPFCGEGMDQSLPKPFVLNYIDRLPPLVIKLCISIVLLQAVISFMRSFFILTLMSLCTPAWVGAWEVLSSFEDLHLDRTRDFVVWDLDHTLIEPMTYEGSEPWFQQILHTAKGHLPTSAAIDLYCASQNHVTLRLTEETLSDKWVQWAGVPMMGLTSRSYCLADLTHGHLKRLGIPLEQTVFDGKHFPEAASQGILFTSGGVKRDYLKKVLALHPEYRERTIIFIDDSVHHLDLMEAFLTEEGIAHRIYLYSASRDKYESARHIS